MPLDFPNNPTLNQPFIAAAGTTWIWDGAKWVAGSPPSSGGSFEDVYNVKDFGAKGDGTTDDTAAIHATVASLPASGGVLYFPAGRYLVSAGTHLPNNTTVISNRAATILAAPFANWGGVIDMCFDNASNPGHDISIIGMRFQFPYGNASYGSGPYAVAHILNFSNVTNVMVSDCVSDGGANFVSLVGCTNTYIEGCSATNVSNCAYDHWGGTTWARCIGNYATTWPGSDVGVSCINYTGINTDQSPATTTCFICIGNQITVNNGTAQGISINGSSSGGSDSKIIISGNHINIAGVAAWGILVGGYGNNGIISDNYIENGVAPGGTYSAIGVFPAAVNWSIRGNRIYNWNVGAGTPVLNCPAVGCSVVGNSIVSCSMPPFGTFDGSTTVYGNDTGAGGFFVPCNAVFSNTSSFSSTATFSGQINNTGGNTVVGWNGAGGATVSINAGVSYHGLQLQVAGNNRFALDLTGEAESGSNTGSNFVVYACNDAGSAVYAPISIQRSNGAVSLPQLQTTPSYANDAAAAAGGVAVGQLYRNGSVVQIRVT